MSKEGPSRWAQLSQQCARVPEGQGCHERKKNKISSNSSNNDGRMKPSGQARLAVSRLLGGLADRRGDAPLQIARIRQPADNVRDPDLAIDRRIDQTSV